MFLMIFGGAFAALAVILLVVKLALPVKEYAAYKPIREDLMKLYQVKSTVDTARRQQEQTQHRDRDMER